MTYFGQRKIEEAYREWDSIVCNERMKRERKQKDQALKRLKALEKEVMRKCPWVRSFETEVDDYGNVDYGDWIEALEWAVLMLAERIEKLEKSLINYDSKTTKTKKNK